ncbi:MAG TPA: pseudaminic acid synthase [Bacillota bacterium]|nr:pseudaminic acid synthase [Bacillota bacterium]
MSVKLVAELSANHNHKIEIAKDTIRAAKESGADAVKLQTYTPDTLTIDCDNDYFKLTQGTIWDGTTLYQLYQQAYTPWEWHRELFAYAEDIGIEIFSTPFDRSAVDLLEALDNPIYKIASFEITDLPLINYAASKGKPMIISTGIATLDEIEAAVSACRNQGCDDITLLQCTSEYPARPEDANLLTMLDLKKRFDVKIGLSDHTMGFEVPVVAASMGAALIEKHFIIDRGIGGPDATFSMTPDELLEMTEKIRNIEKILGRVNYEIDDSKEKSRTFSRSLFVVEDVKKGQMVTEKNVRSIRPGYGISPKYLEKILGEKFTEDVERGTPMRWELIRRV